MTPRAWRSELAKLPAISAAREGERAVATGTVIAIGEPLAAPLSGIACVAYHAVARGKAPFPVDITVVQPFMVDADAEGRWRVDAGTAILALPTVPRRRFRRSRVRLFEAMHRVQPFLGFLRCTERLVAVGARVSVAGVVALDGDSVPTSDAGFRTATLALMLVAGSEEPVVVVAAQAPARTTR